MCCHYCYYYYYWSYKNAAFYPRNIQTEYLYHKICKRYSVSKYRDKYEKHLQVLKVLNEFFCYALSNWNISQLQLYSSQVLGRLWFWSPEENTRKTISIIDKILDGKLYAYCILCISRMKNLYFQRVNPQKATLQLPLTMKETEASLWEFISLYI